MIFPHKSRQLEHCLCTKVVAGNYIALDGVHGFKLNTDESCRLFKRKRLCEAVNTHFVGNLISINYTLEVFEVENCNFFYLFFVFGVSRVKTDSNIVIGVGGNAHNTYAVVHVFLHFRFPVVVINIAAAIGSYGNGDILTQPFNVCSRDKLVLAVCVADTLHKAAYLFFNSGYLLVEGCCRVGQYKIGKGSKHSQNKADDGH